MRCYNCIKYIEQYGQCEVTCEKVNRSAYCSFTLFAEKHWRKDNGGEYIGTITKH